MKRLVQSTLGRFGYRLSRVQARLQPPAASLERFFPAMKRLGFDPKRVIDVGANHGDWTRKAMEFFPSAHYTLVEPQDHLKIHAKDLIGRGDRIEWVNAGVADKPGTLPFTMDARDHSSSFRSDPGGAPAAGTIPVRVTTLNEIVAQAGAAAPEMVKIDAEGFDLKALAGASELFGRTEIFLVEAAIACTGFENTLAAVIGAMDRAGYRAIDFTDLNRSPKDDLLWLCEAAFLLKSSRLLQGVTAYE